MDYAVLAGDARMPALAALLRERGSDARYIANADAAEALIPKARNIVTHCPPRLGMEMERVLELASQDARVYICGPKAHPGDARVIDLWADKALKVENARLTAEGAVSAAMAAGRRSLKDLPTLVVGWGRIGRALTELLVAMGARVMVASRSLEHRHRAIQRGAEAVSLEKLNGWLPGMALVFSTAPAMVLDAPRLQWLDRSAMVIDLASPPYGVDLPAAWQLGLRAWREPGLPGRYCPESAAEALLNAMERGNGI